MFMPGDQPSEAEIREGERQASMNVQLFTAACVALFFSPHVVDWAYKLF